MAAQMEAGPDMLGDADEDIEVTQRRKKRRRRAVFLALGLGTVYYAAAIAYYSQRGRKKCRGWVNPDPIGNCSASCWTNWDAVDAVYFATVTMASVGYGDIKPETTENMAVTLFFLLFGFIVSSPPAPSPPLCHTPCRLPVPLPRARRRPPLVNKLLDSFEKGRLPRRRLLRLIPALRRMRASASAHGVSQLASPLLPPEVLVLPRRRAARLAALLVLAAGAPDRSHPLILFSSPSLPLSFPLLLSSARPVTRHHQVVFPSIATALAPVYQGLEFIFFRMSDATMRVIIGKKGDGTLVDLDGDGLADYEEPPAAYLYYLKGVSSWLIMWLLTQTIFAVRTARTHARKPCTLHVLVHAGSGTSPSVLIRLHMTPDSVAAADGGQGGLCHSYSCLCCSCSHTPDGLPRRPASFQVLYVVMDPGTFSFGSAFYFCIVTATTVGYGDIYVSDVSGHRLFASFHILYSVSSLAALLNTVQVLHSERQIQIRKATLLKRQLDPDLIQSLDKDNNGLDKLEFVVGMLTKLEILHWDDVEPFLAQVRGACRSSSPRSLAATPNFYPPSRTRTI